MGSRARVFARVCWEKGTRYGWSGIVEFLLCGGSVVGLEAGVVMMYEVVVQ